MEHITGISRSQLRFTTLEDIISKSNTVRFIDAFISSTNIFFVILYKLPSLHPTI
jgi:hypothetical protein